MADEHKRVNLVVERPSVARSPFIGFGLLASLAIGARPLSNAATGAGSFESAIGRFLLIMVTCALAGALLGRLLDGSTTVRLDTNLHGPIGDPGVAPAAEVDRINDPAEQESR